MTLTDQTNKQRSRRWAQRSWTYCRDQPSRLLHIQNRAAFDLIPMTKTSSVNTSYIDAHRLQSLQVILHYIAPFQSVTIYNLPRIKKPIKIQTFNLHTYHKDPLKRVNKPVKRCCHTSECKKGKPQFNFDETVCFKTISLIEWMILFSYSVKLRATKAPSPSPTCSR